MSLRCKWTAFLCAGTILISACLSGCHHPNHTDPSAAKEIAAELTLDTEMVACFANGDLLRIESITPGLDTYRLSVAMYSLSKDQVLWETDWGEGDWFTDWIDDGFYAVSLNNQTIQFYDEQGRLVEIRAFPTQFGRISVLMVSPDKNTYFLCSGEECRMYLYDPSSDTAKDVGQMLFGYQKPMGFKDGYFYLEGETDVLRIKPDAHHAETAYCLNQGLIKYPDMGIGVDEGIFYVLPTDAGVTHLLTMTTEGELPLAAAGNRFVAGNGGNTAYLYDSFEQTVQTLPMDAPIVGALLMEGHVLLDTLQNGRHRLYSVAMNAAAAQPLATLPPPQSTPPSPPPPSSSSAMDTTTTKQTESTTTQDVPSTAPSRSSTTTTKRTSSKPTKDVLPSTPPRRKSYRISSVPMIPQMPDYPTGCESVSAVMVLKYWGKQITVDEFIDQYLPQSSYFYSDKGVLYGPSPYEYFIGNPRTTTSYGCMAPVIKEALKLCCKNKRLVKDTTGTSVEDLCREYIDRDIPVLLWATIDMQDTYTSATWKLEDGSLFVWPKNEHCMVLVGYDEKYYYFNDPYSGQVQKYTKKLTEKQYQQLGYQSVVMMK